MINGILNTLTTLKIQKPVILNLTNFVTMDFVANCLLCVGASPIMSVCEEELEELIIISAGVCINIGTIDNNFFDLIKKAIKIAHKHNKPIIFNPVGVGASKIRNIAARYITPKANIIRGNASEIISLECNNATSKGVDTSHTTNDAKETAKMLAKKYNIDVIVSGEIDFITNGTMLSEVNYGSKLMQVVTGMGCALSAVISAFNSVIDDSYIASYLATLYFSLCGIAAAQNNNSPGTFKSSFLDQLYNPDIKLLKEIYDQRRFNN